MVDQATWAVNSCSSSDELGAQNVGPHQKTIKRKRSPNLEGMYLPETSICCVVLQKLEQRRKTRILVVPSDSIHEEVQVPRVYKDGGGSGISPKG